MAVYKDRSADDVNQGDIFDGVSFTAITSITMMGMVVSHDCDCDKFLKPKNPIPDEQRPLFPITVAPVHLISQLPPEWASLVRESRMPRYLHLPAEGEFEELVVDLWHEQPVPIVTVLEQTRLASLSDEWRSRLWTQIIRLRTRRNLRELAQALEGAE